MDALPKEILQATTPSRSETVFSKIPFLGWAIAHTLQDQRFQPIEKAYKRLLNSRNGDEALAQWPPDQRADAARLMIILEEELGWKPAHFIPTDPCLVAFWAHEDGLDSVAATARIQDEWKMKFTDQELAKSLDADLQDLITWVKAKANQP